MHLNWADYAIIAVIVFSAGISFARGFIREILSILGWVIVFWVSIAYYDNVAHLFIPYITSQTTRQIIAFVLLFICTLTVTLLVNFFISQALHKGRFYLTDRILGVLFGSIRGILLVSVFLLLVIQVNLTSFTQSDAWNDSTIIPKLMPIVEWFQSLLPENMDQVMDMKPSQENSTMSKYQAREFSIT
jgi:membrane protein required for colicin V production